MRKKELSKMGIFREAPKNLKQENEEGEDLKREFSVAQLVPKASTKSLKNCSQESGPQIYFLTRRPPVTFSPVMEIKESLLDRRKASFAAERMLDLLEQYQIAITDPNESPDLIRALVSFLYKQMNDMARWEDKLAFSDPLQKILIELKILSSVQIAIFHREDIV